MHILMRFIVMMTMVCLFAGCASNDNMRASHEHTSDETFGDENHKTSESSEHAGDEDMTEEALILAAFERMQQAMIDKDIETLYLLVTEDKTFMHMSGKIQSKEAFFGEIADGTLNYYQYEIHHPVITVLGDRAELIADVTLTAKVYGMSGTWTLATHAYFIKIAGNWIQCNAFD